LNLFSRLHYCPELIEGSAQLCHTLVRSVRYWAFAKFSFEYDVFSIRAVDEKQTPTAAK
jgi:hypothetical protein